MFKSRCVMKVAIVGSRGLSNIALDKYISHNATEIVSGGSAVYIIQAPLGIRYSPLYPQTTGQLE